MGRDALASRTFDTRLGRLLVAATEEGIAAVVLGVAGDGAAERERLSVELERPVLDADNPMVARAVKQLEAYLDGRRKGFSVPCDVLRGTPFQRAVWDALRGIPHGETRSYAQVANRIGRPTAVRAVAQACGRNPIPVIIPCHRVIASDGGIGGFSSGLALKRRLLAVERGAAEDLPLFGVVAEQKTRRRREQRQRGALSTLPEPLQAWLTRQLDPQEERAQGRPASTVFSVDTFLAEALEVCESSTLAALAEMITDNPACVPGTVLHQIAQALVEAVGEGLLAGGSLEARPLGSLLRAAARLGLSWLELLARHLVERPRLPRAVVDTLEELFVEVLEGKRQVGKDQRERVVDLWLDLKASKAPGSWAALRSADPSEVYERAGLWTDAIAAAETALATGAGDRKVLLERLSRLYEQVGELRAAAERTISLMAELGDAPEARRRLRQLQDRLTRADQEIAEKE